MTLYKPKESNTNVAASVSMTRKHILETKTRKTPKAGKTTKDTIKQDPNSSVPLFVSPDKLPN